MCPHPRCIGRRAQAARGGQVKGQRHAERHAFAMQQTVRKAGFGFKGMPKGMAEVEQGADIAGLAFIGSDHRRLGTARYRDRLGLCRRIAGQQCGRIGLAPIEETGVADQAVFHHLGIAGAQVAQRQGLQHLRIDQHQRRLVEGANKVLAGGRVDRGLAAHRRIDLGEQSRRHLHEPATTPQDAGGKAGQVTDDAAAQRHHRIAAFDSQLQQALGDLGERRPVLAGFPRWQHDFVDRDAGGRQPGGKGRQVQRRNMSIGYQRQPAPRRQRPEQRRRIGQQPRRNMDGVGTIAEGHGDDHAGELSVGGRLAAINAAMIAATVSPCGVDLLAMRIGACA